MNQDETSPESPAGKCTSCGAELPSGTRFCPECGTEVPTGATCPSCGEQVQAGERFCRYCGTQVAAFTSGRAPATGAIQPEAEARPTAGPAEPTSAQETDSSPPEDDLRRASERPASGYRTFDPSAITCPRCGAQASAYDSFCNSCGLPFDEQEPSQATQPAFRYGAFCERFVARLIDGFILLAVNIALTLTAIGNWLVTVDSEVPLWYTITSYSIPFLYHGFFISYWSTTPGKRVMGLKVVTTRGERLNFLHAVARELATIVSALPLMIGYLVSLFREDRRALHDLLVDTVVIYDDR